MTPLEAITSIISQACQPDAPTVRLHLTIRLTTDDDGGDEPPELPPPSRDFLESAPRCHERIRPHKRAPTASMNRLA